MRNPLIAPHPLPQETPILQRGCRNGGSIGFGSDDYKRLTLEVNQPLKEAGLETSLHHVKPVTRGARVSSFFWIQSMVRDDGQRSLLFDLDLAIQCLSRDHPDHPSAVQLTGVYHNLIRQWAEM
jgi:hypothetical protein